MSVRPPDRKEKIEAAAAELFAAGGFAAVGVDDIGARVGITGPAIYRHFAGKDALLRAVVLETVRSFGIDDAAVAEGIRRMVADTVATALDHPARLATYVRERHRLTGSDRRALTVAEQDLFARWREAIRAARPDLDDARITTRQAAILAALSAVALRPLTVARPHLDELMVDAMVAVLLAPTTKPARSRASDQGWSPPTSRREEILAHALALFRTRGFGGVGIDEVGEAAGISGPTVYFHYDSKVGILLDAFERAGTRVAAGVHDALGVAISTADALDRLARSYLQVAMDNVDLIVVTSREGGALPEAERPRLARRRREIRDAWVAVVRELRPDLSAAGARTLVAGVFPLMNQLAQQGGEVEEPVGLARAFLLDGVSSEK